jgi:hypothetical protein
MTTPAHASARQRARGTRASPWIACLAPLLLLVLPGASAAHEIPESVRVLLLAGVEGAAARSPDPGAAPATFRLFVTAPLPALRELDPPLHGDGTLDVAETRPLLPDAVRLWIGDELALHVAGQADPPLTLRSVRLAAPGDLRFPSLEAAAAARDARLPDDVRIPPGQLRVVAEFSAPLPRADARLRLTSRLEHLGQRTRTVLRSRTADGRLHAFTWTGARGSVPLAPGLGDTVGSLFPSGFEHVLGGVDHLLFVFCLVLPVRRLGPLLMLVSAFTVAHSITLGAAALGVVPSALWFGPAVEVGIAASVVWLALLNLLGRDGAERWPLAFAFGLLHGFGFAGALTDELQWAGDHVLVALAAFNLGIEAGQLFAVVVFLALLRGALALGLPERPPGARAVGPGGPRGLALADGARRGARCLPDRLGGARAGDGGRRAGRVARSAARGPRRVAAGGPGPVAGRQRGEPHGSPGPGPGRTGRGGQSALTSSVEMVTSTSSLTAGTA